MQLEETFLGDSEGTVFLTVCMFVTFTNTGNLFSSVLDVLISVGTFCWSGIVVHMFTMLKTLLETGESSFPVRSFSM